MNADLCYEPRREGQQGRGSPTPGGRGGLRILCEGGMGEGLEEKKGTEGS